MTTSEGRRFPIGLTLAAAIGIAILIGLGVWQLQRLKWKRAMLARIEAAGSVTQPIGPVLNRAARGEDVEFSRVLVACAGPLKPTRTTYVYGLEGSQVVWRVLAACPLAEGPYGGLVIDRGIAAVSRGLMAPPRAMWPFPRAVVGILRRPEPKPFGTYPALGDPIRFPRRDPIALGVVAKTAGVGRLAPWVLMSDGETPAPPGIAPAPLPANIPNRHLEYALTWFGLAGALGGVYLAVLWRRAKA
ncbi:MAG TPA: SURF1 family cytochrome oxidase biogenesis protein [Caulobacteraceae bacterium]|nr:SURF1 family cytochrome oxidase biogenesis protein [Caulobacteraceae bacterium]